MRLSDTPIACLGGERLRATGLWVIVLSCLAFGLFWSDGLFVRMDATADAVLFHYTGRVVKIAVCFIVALIAWKRIIDTRVLFVSTCIPLVLYFALSLITSRFGQTLYAVEIAAHALNGISGAFLTLLFAQLFSAFSPRLSQTMIPFAFMLSHAVFVSTVLIPIEDPFWIKLGAAVISPLLLFICLRKMGLLKPLHDERSPADGAPGKRASERSSNRYGLTGLFLFIKEYSVVIVGAVVFPLLYGIIAQIYTEANISAGLFDLTTEVIAVIVLFSMSLFACFWKKQFKLNRAFIIVSLPLFATAIFLVGDRLFLSGTIAKSAMLLYHASFWVFLARKAYEDPSLTYTYFGFAQGTCHLCAMLGRIIGYQVHGVLESNVEILVTASLLAFWMLTIVSLRFLSTEELREHADRQSLTGNDPFMQKCEAFVSTYGLSEREAEVLLYFVRGRSANHIGKLLSITNNTVKTHLRNIYIKAGVHSRQDLLDLIETGEITQEHQTG